MSLMYTMETFMLPRGFLIMHSSSIALEKTHILHAGSYVLEFIILLILLLSGYMMYIYLNLRRNVKPSKSNDIRKLHSPSPKVLAKIKETTATTSTTAFCSPKAATVNNASAKLSPTRNSTSSTQNIANSISTQTTPTSHKKRNCSNSSNSTKTCTASPKKKSTPRFSYPQNLKLKNEGQKHSNGGGGNGGEKNSGRSTTHKSNESIGASSIAPIASVNKGKTTTVCDKAVNSSQQQRQQNVSKLTESQQEIVHNPSKIKSKSRSRNNRRKNQTMPLMMQNDYHCWVPVEDPNNFFLDYYTFDEDILYRQMSQIIIPVRRLPRAGYPFMPNDHPNFGVFFNSTPCVTPIGDLLYNESYDSMSEPEMLEKWYQDQRYIEKYFMNDDVRNRRECSRCKSKFFGSISGPCFYHPGRLFFNFMNPKEVQYSCCNSSKKSDGCVSASDHVWNGLIPGLNGPIDGFVITAYPSLPATKHRVVALDCEMCFTIKGLELTRVTLLNLRGDVIYDSLVMPENAIIDYNTPFSGITKESLEKPGAAVSLRKVQQDILQLVDSETIFVGHGLENDLRALKMVHHVVIDTALLYTDSPDGLPGKRHSLKNLSLWYLKRRIQDNECGHDSVEDARACLDLVKHWVTLTANHQSALYAY